MKTFAVEHEITADPKAVTEAYDKLTAEGHEPTCEEVFEHVAGQQFNVNEVNPNAAARNDLDIPKLLKGAEKKYREKQLMAAAAEAKASSKADNTDFTAEVVTAAPTKTKAQLLTEATKQLVNAKAKLEDAQGEAAKQKKNNKETTAIGLCINAVDEALTQVQQLREQKSTHASVPSSYSEASAQGSYVMKGAE